MKNKSIIIIGAGFAGLCTGIYGQMNGYKTQIFEMHNMPGGLCTAWQRKGYTIDSCIHWLVGSNPNSFMHRMWEEVGISQGRQIINADIFTRYETADGRVLTLYSNIDRLEQHLLEFAPEDSDAIKEYTGGMRTCLDMSQAQDWGKWMQISTGEFAKRIKNPALRAVIGGEPGMDGMAMFGMLFTFAYLHNQDAGYPIGGSLPMSKALEKRYLGLGGNINYKSRVEKILVEDDRAVGVKLSDGNKYYASRVISGADGYTTIFKMLDGKYADAQTREPYENWTPFPSLLYIGIGVNRLFPDEPVTVSGFSFALKSPVEIGDSILTRLPVHIYNQDPTLAPPGKTSLVIMLPSKIDYWRELVKKRTAYNKKKKQIGQIVVALLEQRFPGISEQVEMIDVATPLTWERYTGNWNGSFEGWMPPPQNIMKPMSKTLPGLDNFYMVGQWVGPGGGLPTGLIHGREVIQTLCAQDGSQFITTVPE